MLRLSILFASLIAAASASIVPTTYCESARDLVNVAGTLEANVWPPTLGSTVELNLKADLDEVILNSSFQMGQKFDVKNGHSSITFDVPKGAHTGLYQIDVHGRKNGQEVYCVQASWQLTSTPEDRGTAELWADVAKRIAELDEKRAQVIEDAVNNPPSPEESDIPQYVPEFDPIEAHANMVRTHDQVHKIYPHMMNRQRKEIDIDGQ